MTWKEYLGMQFKLTESQIQILIFDWVELHKHKYPELELLYHIPNGGYRNIATAKRLKAEGVKPGVPDLCLPVSRGEYHGLYLEMKAEKGKLSEQQIHWLQALQNQGYKALVAYSFDQAIETLQSYLNENEGDHNEIQ